MLTEGSGMPPAVEAFYDELAPFYDLVFEDWDASIARQAQALSHVIRTHWPAARTVLDVSCGIGTQAIGLAMQGYAVHASDVSGAAVERAKAESSKRGAGITFEVGDMRTAALRQRRRFDVVVSADNSVPHLLGNDDIREAFRAFRGVLEPGGGCIVTVRDYEQEARGANIVKPYGERVRDGRRYKLWQAWDFDGDHYDFTFFIEETAIDSGATHTHAFRSRYYAVPISTLCELMTMAGFEDVARVDGVFYQPVIIGTNPL